MAALHCALIAQGAQRSAAYEPRWFLGQRTRPRRRGAETEQRPVGSLPAGHPERTVEIDTEVGRVKTEAVGRQLSVDPVRAGFIKAGERDPAAVVLNL